jgi:hypothetical protein
MRDASGRPVAPWDLWRSSLMGQAARDPFFRATVAAEVASTPAAADAIERDCMACHAPAAFAEQTLLGLERPGLAALGSDEDLGDLARDGVNCVGCHLQDPARTGLPETWSGHHAYDAERRLYGPHADPFASAMQGFADFTPTHHPGAVQGRMCAGCHTLQTATLAPDGTPTGHTLTEQAPYLEWRSSDFDPARGLEGAATCQDCHLPTVDEDGVAIETILARNGGGGDFRIDPRAPYGRHVMVGGNAFALEVIRDQRKLLNAGVLAEDFDLTIAATRAALAGAARVTLSAPLWRGDDLVIDVRIDNLVGHKLPTGYPARRAWLHVRVADADGATVFEVGAVDAAGRLVDHAGPLASEAADGPLEPHRTEIRSPSDVVVWQSWMADVTGAPTSRLLRGASYAKDTRLLPRGYAPSAEDAPLIAPVGTDADADFGPGGDGVRLVLPVGDTGAATVTVTVEYQAFSPRFLDELLAVDVPETRGLAIMLAGRGVPAEHMATAQVLVPAR